MVHSFFLRVNIVTISFVLAVRDLWVTFIGFHICYISVYRNGIMGVGGMCNFPRLVCYDYVGA